MSWDCHPHPRGALAAVRVHAGARRTAIVGLHDGALRIDVSAAPEKGKANRAVVALLAETFALARSDIEVLHGATAPRKAVLLVGLTPAEASARLTQAGIETA